MRCARYDSGKKAYLKKKQSVEDVTMTTNDRVNGKNDSSPRSCHAQSSASHSTPDTKKPVAEESPDVDYSPSLMLFPCTQEGGNEVAWDWQSSLSRSPENRNKRRNVQCETPKGTKLLQRKRNSNSPLLHQPLKRKTMKLQNIENIGQFAAELQALNEKMRVIKQNDREHSNVCVKREEASTNACVEEEMSKVRDERSNADARSNVGETTDRTDAVKKEAANGSYDDLFDDSVDDDMIKCTQEIEKKFSLQDKESFTQSPTKKGDQCTDDASSRTQSGSKESCRKSSVSGVSGASNNKTLKTYSKLSLRRDSGIHTAQRSKDPDKPCLNNNNTTSSRVEKLRDSKKLPKSNTVDSLNFSDDSFDDLLTTCFEDEKLILLSSYGCLTRKDGNAKVQANYKHLTDAPLKSEAKSADLLKPTAKPEMSSANFLEKRKFFKFKSLSDQYANRDASTSVRDTTNTTRPTLQHFYSSRGPISRTSVARIPVRGKRRW
ncbi:PREDICTED: uncharacterized protein LOC105561823 isoform X2 [Vollenhovia emeryi]|uniref:uncharacterized protein LOC105561823 isoform X2 n=1 Tax=Vollenhovia emeryi TaxID=411798 RepID=UPI0005F3E0DE|nr:PREDICTED: uncharacterized protein LOC105561823 isoform X2 [Vollenhovia emeryi]